MTTYQAVFVTPSGQEVHTTAGEEEYLLEVGRRAGLDLPYRCLQGWCTTCAGKLLEGCVDQTEARRLYVQDEQAGFVLLCCAYARSAVRILTHQTHALRVHRRQHRLPAPGG